MDTSAVKAIVEKYELEIRRAMGVSHWNVVYVYGDCEDRENTTGTCQLLLDYWGATITLDPAKIADTDQLIRTLVHELGHIVLAPLDLYRDATREHIKDGAAKVGADRLWTHVVETTNVHLERILRDFLPPLLAKVDLESAKPVKKARR